MDARVRGSEQLAALGAELKRLSRGDLRRRLLREIRAAATPLGEEARKRALETLPKSGGLAAEVAATPVKVRTSLSASSARVRLIDPAHHRLRSIDRGRLRHPVFGNRDHWVTQHVPPGWWTETMRAGSPHVRAAIVRTVQTVNEELAR